MSETDAARERLARAQYALLAALVTDTPAPPGFDPRRVAVQRRALQAKRAGVVAKVAPELAALLGDDYHRLFLGYAAKRSMTDGYRRDAADFARHLIGERAVPEPQRGRLAAWLSETTGPPAGPLRRLLTALRGGRKAVNR
ncbi:hypothetical protein GCM10020221_19470 [Streptomyces thioluteus]|uniref:SCO6045-like C-terminal domain-containing protein n=1 Tax=Streptomyces thioluteus TaxID=66431 RepID=A0ABN3WRX3_STRTU